MEISHVYGNAMSLAIPLNRRIRTLVDGHETETEEAFYPNPNFPVYVVLQKNNHATSKQYEATMEGNLAIIRDDNCCLPVGTYSIEICCRDENENHLRYMQRGAVEIVDATAESGIEPGIEFNAELYTLEAAVFFYAKGDPGEPGVSITSVEQIVTSHESGGTNVVRVTLSNGEQSEFEVRNGEAGFPTYEAEEEALIF